MIATPTFRDLRASFRWTLIVLAIATSAAGQTLALVPAEMDLSIQPGKPIQFDIHVANKGSDAVPAKVTVTDLWYNAKNEKTFGPAGSSPRSAANWIEFVPRQFTIPGNGTATVKVLVTPPADIAGGYYAVIFVESKPEMVQAPSQENQNRAVFANIRLGSLILLSTNIATYKAEISDATLTPPTESRDLSVRFTLSNTGDTHLFPLAKLAIVNAQHQLIATAQADTKRFLPGQKDSMEVRWSGTLRAGDYTGLLTILYGKDKVYTQELNFSSVTGAAH